jgi:hypothetical protein
MSKILIQKGTYDETCTVSSNLTQNQIKKPEIRDVIMYAEPRMLSTLIVSGAKAPWDLQVGRMDNVRTKIGKVDQSKMIGDNGYRYQVQGRIQQKSIVVSQVGTTSADGTFVLILKDNYITPSMNVKFYTDGFYARVQGAPSGGPGGFVYTFKSVGPVNFDWNIHVAPQQGEKTAFGAFTTFSARSLRGYGRSHYPSTFINHLTIQRKTIAIDGDAMTDVLWIQPMGKSKGWFFAKEAQARLQFMMEDEHAKWHGTSTMKDINGNLLNVASLIDSETGNEVIAGDGVIPQIDGQNTLFGSASDGGATVDDIKDMMTMLEKKSNAVYGKTWYVVSGTSGYLRIQEALRDYWINRLGGQSTNNSATGNADIHVGGNFDTFSYGGNTIIACKNTMWDDEERWFERNSSGDLVQSNMLLFLDASEGPQGANMEILAKGANGVNRNMVSGYINGITGDDRDMMTSVDAIEFNMLKHNGIFIYNTQSCGIIRMAA